MVGLYKGWRVNGNANKSKDFTNFLCSCRLRNIVPETPVSFNGRQLAVTFSSDEYSTVPDKLPKGWLNCGYKLIINIPPSKKEADRVLDEVFRQMDREGIVLPNSLRWKNAPTIICHRVSAISNTLARYLVGGTDCSEGYKSLASMAEGSEILENPLGISEDIRASCGWRAEFSGNGEYRADLIFEKDRISWLDNLRIEIPGGIKLAQKDLEARFKGPDDRRYLSVRGSYAVIENLSVVEPGEADTGNSYVDIKTKHLDTHGLMVTSVSATDEKWAHIPYYPADKKGSLPGIRAMERVAKWLIGNNIHGL